MLNIWIIASLYQDEKARVIQTLLFVAGINTLFQTFFGSRLPVVMGGSYTFVAPTISIILAGRYNNEADPREVVPSGFGLRISSVSVYLWHFFCGGVKANNFLLLLL